MNITADVIVELYAKYQMGKKAQKKEQGKCRPSK